LGSYKINPVIAAFTRVENVLDMATQPDRLLEVLEEIRKMDKTFDFVPGYTGAWRAKRRKIY